MASLPMDRERLLDFLFDPESSLMRAEYFALRLEEEFKKAWRYRWPMALLLVEVEGLERLAADEGDQVRRAAVLDISGELLSASRDTDLAARLESGRFAVLLTGTDQAGQQAFVDRVLRNIIEGGFHRYVLHIGGSVAPTDDMASVDQFLARAEAGLALAKEQGENRFVCWTGRAR